MLGIAFVATELLHDHNWEERCPRNNSLVLHREYEIGMIFPHLFFFPQKMRHERLQLILHYLC